MYGIEHTLCCLCKSHLLLVTCILHLIPGLVWHEAKLFHKINWLCNKCITAIYMFLSSILIFRIIKKVYKEKRAKKKEGKKH